MTATKLSHLDHLVLTVQDVALTSDFYARVLGMQPVIFAGGRHALAFGRQKINLHQAGREFSPRAHRATPGSADLCFIAAEPLDRVVSHLRDCGVEIIEGPVKRTGALGDMRSVYFRDPDLNLIEVSEYPDAVVAAAQG